MQRHQRKSRPEYALSTTSIVLTHFTHPDLLRCKLSSLVQRATIQAAAVESRQELDIICLPFYHREVFVAYNSKRPSQLIALLLIKRLSLLE